MTFCLGISKWWEERMRRAVQELPPEWIDRAFSRLTGRAPS